MKTAIDTNILLSISQQSDAIALSAIKTMAARGTLCVCPVVYAETGSRFEAKRDLDGFLGDMRVELEGFSSDSAFQAGQLFREYLEKGGSRRRVMPDFLVGAHAMLQANQLLTRDRGFYRQYFRGLRVVEP